MRSDTQAQGRLMWFWIGLAVFVGLGGVFGGIGFLMDVSGGAMGLSPDLLARSPFSNFFIPGLFLLLAMGVFPLTVAAALWRGWPYAWAGALLFSLTLIAFISIEFALIGFAWLQVIFGGVGAVLLLLALRMGEDWHFPLFTSGNSR